MELTLEPGNATYRILSYKAGQITLLIHSKPEIYPLPLVIMPEHLLTELGVQSFADLQKEHFQSLISYKPQVVLLGTGEKMLILKSELLAALSEHHIGIEVMTTAAACRTYTILMSEGRNVAAILFP